MYNKNDIESICEELSMKSILSIFTSMGLESQITTKYTLQSAFNSAIAKEKVNV